MHYYKLNIADWAKDTSHLTLEEEAVYFRLINHYYDSEQAIPLETHSVIRRLRLRGHEDLVGDVLEEFFIKTENGWRHTRCDKLVDEYQARVQRNRKNGSKGGRKPKDGDEETQQKPSGLPSGFPDGNQVDTEKDPTLVNHKPLTTNQEPETNNKDLMSDKSDAVEVLKHLNKVTGQNFKMTTQSHLSAINARIKDGATVEDCKTVIEFKYNQWKGTEQIQYMRPSTLFRPRNFDGYLLAAKSNVKPTKRDVNAIGSDFSKPKGWN